MIAHPDKLRQFLAEYDRLSAEPDGETSARHRRELADITYTLCIATGTRDLDSALAVARTHIQSAPQRPA